VCETNYVHMADYTVMMVIIKKDRSDMSLDMSHMELSLPHKVDFELWRASWITKDNLLLQIPP